MCACVVNICILSKGTRMRGGAGTCQPQAIYQCIIIKNAGQ